MEQEFTKSGNRAGVGVSVKGRYKVQILDRGIIIEERPWSDNLILNQGKDYWGSGVGSFAYLVRACAVGTGTTPPAVTDIGLGSETRRSITYLTGAGNCGYSDVGSTRTLLRTFEFPTETSPVNYTELGWSYSESAGSNLFSRTLISGGTVSLVSGQSLRVVYSLSITVSPSTDTTQSMSVSGWPVLPATGTEVTWRIQGGDTFSQVDTFGNSQKGYIEPGWRQPYYNYYDKAVVFSPAVRTSNATFNGVFTNISLAGTDLHPNYYSGSAVAAYSSYSAGTYSRTLPSLGYITANQFSSTSIRFMGYAPRTSEYYYSDAACVIGCNFTEAQTKETLYRLKFPGFTISITS